MKKISVFLSDDHPIFREGLRLLLETTADIEVVGEAENGQLAVSETKRLQPDVVLMDIALPLLNGVEATRRITREFPTARVLMLSTYGDPYHVQQAVEAGAAGYLMKHAASKDLLPALRETLEGRGYFNPPIAKRLLNKWRKQGAKNNTSAAGALTRRQTEVLHLIAEGHSGREIAGLLSVSIKTIEKHRQAVMNKLNIHKIATLTRYVLSSGLLEPRP